MNPISLINGDFKNEISVFDRGLAYGDGFFETMFWKSKTNVNNNFLGVEFWDRHLTRICQGCKKLKINIPSKKILNGYKNSILNKALESGFDCGTLKLIVTRGIGGRGYKFDKNMKPTVIMIVFPKTKQPFRIEQGVELRFCKSEISLNKNFSGFKHLNRIDSVFARSEWINPNVFEGLVFDNENNVVEGTMTNIFFIKEKTLYTPELVTCGINGIMRQVIIDNHSIFFDDLKIIKIKKNQIFQFDQSFLTNSLIRVAPVSKINRKDFEIQSNLRKIMHYFNLDKNLEIK